MAPEDFPATILVSYLTAQATPAVKAPLSPSPSTVLALLCTVQRATVGRVLPLAGVQMQGTGLVWRI